MNAQPNERATSTSEPKKKPPRGLIMLGVFVVLVVATIVGVRVWLYSSTHESTDDAQVDADLITITSKIAERVDAIPIVTNHFVHRGQILVHLEDRDERQRYAQALAVYNASKAQAEAANANVDLTIDEQRAQVTQGSGGIAQAQASISSARQQQEQAQDQVRVAQANVRVAQAQLDAALGAVQSAQETNRRDEAALHRSEALVRTGDAPTSELDAARAAAASSRSEADQVAANVTVARANLVAAIERLRSERSALAAAQDAVVIQTAGLSTAQGKLSEVSSPFRVTAQRSTAGASTAQVATQAAAVQQAYDQLQDTVIRAPIDGYVGEKTVEVGTTVAPGQTLLTIVPSKHLFVTANFKETQIGHMHPGQSVDISVDAYHGWSFTGHVETMPPASQATYSLIPAQNATGNFVKVTQRLPVRIAVDSGADDDHPLRVGMSVEAAVRVK